MFPGAGEYLRECFLADSEASRVRDDTDRCHTAAWDGLAPQIDAHGEGDAPG